MDSEACTNAVKNVKAFPDTSVSVAKKPIQSYFAAEAKNGVELPLSSAPFGCLEPATPEPNRENGGYLHDFTCSRRVASFPLKSLCFNAHRSSGLNFSPEGESPHTPNEGMFNLFAPGPENLLLAPRPKKQREESRKNVARSLEFFESSPGLSRNTKNERIDEFFSDEEVLFQIVYETLMEAIVTKQAEMLPEKASDSDGFSTPTSTPLVAGVAKSCPGAPKKLPGKPRNIDKGLCRKLVF